MSNLIKNKVKRLCNSYWKNETLQVRGQQGHAKIKYLFPSLSILPKKLPTVANTADHHYTGVFLSLDPAAEIAKQIRGKP